MQNSDSCQGGEGAALVHVCRKLLQGQAQAMPPHALPLPACFLILYTFCIQGEGMQN